MIIQSARLRTNTNLPQLKAHVFAGAANDEIVLLHGDPDDLDAMQDDAAAAAKPFAIRHFKISPAEAASRSDVAVVMRDLAREFSFKLEHCVVVEHAKPRQPGGYGRHWHLLVPEFDPVRRRVLDSHWMRPRQEKIARKAEARLGHALVAGRWNATVGRYLEMDGELDLAAAVMNLAAGPRPTGAYLARQHQAAAREGIALPTYVTVIRDAWNTSRDSEAFKAALERQDILLEPGEKSGIWLAYAKTNGQSVKLGALHRLLKIPRAQVQAVIDAEAEAAVLAM
jgi:hypothetical protein